MKIIPDANGTFNPLFRCQIVAENCVRDLNFLHFASHSWGECERWKGGTGKVCHQQGMNSELQVVVVVVVVVVVAAAAEH